MKKEEIIKHLHEALNSVDITFPYRYVLVEAIEALSAEPELPSNLDEAAEEATEEYVYNEGGPFPGTTGVSFINGFKAGAEWMTGQFQKIEGELVDWYSTSDRKEYCCGVKTQDAFEVPEGFYIRKKQKP